MNWRGVHLPREGGTWGPPIRQRPRWPDRKTMRPKQSILFVIFLAGCRAAAAVWWLTTATTTSTSALPRRHACPQGPPRRDASGERRGDQCAGQPALQLRAGSVDEDRLRRVPRWQGPSHAPCHRRYGWRFAK